MESIRIWVIEEKNEKIEISGKDIDDDQKAFSAGRLSTRALRVQDELYCCVECMRVKYKNTKQTSRLKIP